LLSCHGYDQISRERINYIYTGQVPRLTTGQDGVIERRVFFLCGGRSQSAKALAEEAGLTDRQVEQALRVKQQRKNGGYLLNTVRMTIMP
jgi:hypothetical protein